MALGTVAGVVAGMIGARRRQVPEHRQRGRAGHAVRVPGAGRRGVRGSQRVLRRLKHEAAVLRRRLAMAKTTMRQRDAILEATTAAVDRGGHNLANLRSLEPPASRQALLAETARLWEGNLEHLRKYALRLDRVSNRRELLKAIDPLTDARPAMERDFVGVKAGLQRLGGEDCAIDLYIAKPIPLPNLPNPTARRRPEVPQPTAQRGAADQQLDAAEQHGAAGGDAGQPDIRPRPNTVPPAKHQRSERRRRQRRQRRRRRLIPAGGHRRAYHARHDDAAGSPRTPRCSSSTSRTASSGRRTTATASSPTSAR